MLASQSQRSLAAQADASGGLWAEPRGHEQEELEQGGRAIATGAGGSLEQSSWPPAGAPLRGGGHELEEQRLCTICKRPVL